jgi:hypothetical protein
MPRYFRNARYNEQQSFRGRGNYRYNDYQSYRGRSNSRGRGRGRGWSRGGSRDRSRSHSVTQTLTRLGLNEQQIRAVLNLRDGTGNFDDASNLCFQYAKLFNQKQNWQKLPKTLQYSLDRFINSIHLPMSNSYSRDEIKDATAEFAERLCEIVRFHLLQQSEILVEKLKQSHIGDIRPIQQDTARRLKPRFSNNFIDNCWSALDADMHENHSAHIPGEQAPVSVPHNTALKETLPTPIVKPFTAVSGPPAASTSAPDLKAASVNAVLPTDDLSDVEPPDDTSAIGVTSVVAKPPTSTVPTVDTDHSKRPAPAPPAGPSNPVSAKRTLTPDQEQPQPKHGRLQTSNSSPISVNSADSETSEGIITDDIRDNSNRWSIGKVPVKCSTVIIGDSNLINWDKKERYYIKSFRGAHLVDITRILVNWDPPSHVGCLVIAAGVNNHVKTNQQNMSEMNELLTTLNSFSFDKYFVEIHISPLHTDVALTRLHTINSRALDSFGDAFIKLKMFMKYTDTQHYDKETASAISKHIFHFLH